MDAIGVKRTGHILITKIAFSCAEGQSAIRSFIMLVAVACQIIARGRLGGSVAKVADQGCHRRIGRIDSSLARHRRTMRNG